MISAIVGALLFGLVWGLIWGIGFGGTATPVDDGDDCADADDERMSYYTGQYRDDDDY